MGDHNLILIVRITKVGRPGPTVIFKRSYKMFNHDEFVNDVKKICWSEVISVNNPETALCKFNNPFLPQRHAPLKKFTVRNAVIPWLDKEIKDSMKMRDQMKKTTIITGNKCDWDLYHKRRNSVTNQEKKENIFENQVNNVGNDSKKV